MLFDHNSFHPFEIPSKQHTKPLNYPNETYFAIEISINFFISQFQQESCDFFIVT